MEKAMANAIVDFLSQGGSLTTDAGTKLLDDSPREIIKEAAASDPEVIRKLTRAREESSDSHLRRKLMLAVTDALQE